MTGLSEAARVGSADAEEQLVCLFLHVQQLEIQREDLEDAATGPWAVVVLAGVCCGFFSLSADV
jgi:hypothetical protein